MTITLDRKVATGLLSKAITGNDLLSVLEMITSTFTDGDSAVTEPTAPTPTLEEIEF
jgi:hypothetical protein